MRTWSGACQVAAVYIGTVIGAGFATGREIVQFFSQFGLYGLLTIMISGLLFIFLGAKMMTKAIDLQAPSFQEFNTFLFGRSLGMGVTVIQFCMLIGVTGVMLSGTGALFEERWDVSANTGIVVTMAAGFLVVQKGVKGLLAVNVFVVPLMLLFHFVLAAEAAAGSYFWQSLFTGGEGLEPWKLWVAPFSYTALNLTLAQAVLVPLAYEIKDKRVIKRGAFLGGAILTLLMLASHVSLLQIGDISRYEIPMAKVVEQLMPAFHYIYVFLIYGEIFTSVVGNAYGLKQQLESHVNWSPAVLLSLIFGAGFLLSQISYSTLLGFLYPLFGMISLLFLLLLWKK
ncbi:YkvI family membrane protein [Bacillus xiapuensis]|uniref:YkvI family membrane protein n=1 Tax=Bacillus xiapuensis TaxID=2014075 RepID=UPI000C234556|nr:hypothetical protein [Bacillus xiapuensis]